MTKVRQESGQVIIAKIVPSCAANVTALEITGEIDGRLFNIARYTVDDNGNAYLTILVKKERTIRFFSARNSWETKTAYGKEWKGYKSAKKMNEALAHYHLTLEQVKEMFKAETENAVEIDADEYAVSVDAQEIAMLAEIEAAINARETAAKEAEFEKQKKAQADAKAAEIKAKKFKVKAALDKSIQSFNYLVAEVEKQRLALQSETIPSRIEFGKKLIKHTEEEITAVQNIVEKYSEEYDTLMAQEVAINAEIENAQAEVEEINAQNDSAVDAENVRKEISKIDYRFFLGRVEKIAGGEIEALIDTQRKAVELLGAEIPQNVFDATNNYKAFNMWLGSEINPIIVSDGGYKEEIRIFGDGYDFFEVKTDAAKVEEINAENVDVEKLFTVITQNGETYGLPDGDIAVHGNKIFDLHGHELASFDTAKGAEIVADELTAAFENGNEVFDFSATVEKVNAKKNPLKEKIQSAELAAENVNATRHAFLKNFYLKMCGNYCDAEGFIDYVTDYAKIIYRRDGYKYIEDADAFAELKKIEDNLKALYRKVAELKNIAEKAVVLKAKIAEQKNSRKSVIDWTDAIFQNVTLPEIFKAQKELKKFLKLGQLDLAENIFAMLKTLCKNYRVA